MRHKIEKLFQDHSLGFGIFDADKLIPALEELFNYELKKIDGKFIPPNSDQVFDYLISGQINCDGTISDIRKIADEFVNYYSSVNWRVGKSKKPMSSWKKAISNWVNRSWNKDEKSKVQESIKAYMMLQNQKK